MSKLKWDQIGERIYETGLDHGVLYPVTKSGTYDKGVAWNGLSAVNESPSGAEANPVWADNIKYLNLISAEDFGRHGGGLHLSSRVRGVRWLC